MPLIAAVNLSALPGLTLYFATVPNFILVPPTEDESQSRRSARGAG
jgi:hypothetical protein